MYLRRISGKSNGDDRADERALTYEVIPNDGGRIEPIRRTAVIVGVLFITATVAYSIGIALIDPIIDSPDYLTEIAENENQVKIGSLFVLIDAVAVVGIAVMIFPVLRRVNESLALWYVGARITESILFIAYVFSVLMLVTLSQNSANAGAIDAPHLQISGDQLAAMGEWIDVINYTAVFAVGALFLYSMLYISKLVPRFLSAWGFIGAICCIVAGLSIMFGVDSSSMVVIALFLPIAVNEMALAIWLIAKGFNPSALASLPGKASESPD